MRIVIAIENYPLGAAETYALSVAKGLAEKGHDLLVTVPSIGRSEAAAWIRGSVDLHVLSESPIQKFRETVSLLRRLQPDIVHVNQPASAVLVAAHLTHVPVRVLTNHVLPASPQYNLRGRLLAGATRRATNSLIVFSEQNARAATLAWPGSEPTLVYPGVSALECKYGRRSERERLGISDSDFVVCTVGRLSEEKQHDVFIRALAIARERNTNIRAIVVGGGPEEETLRCLIADLGLSDAVALTGHRNDVGCFLLASDLYVQCSRWGREGLGFALLEAMAARLPAVVSDLPAFREVVATTSAPIVPIGAYAELADRICELKDAPDVREGLGEALHERWMNQFTVDRMVGDHETLYEQTAAKAGRRKRQREVPR